jgi:hypothetical protein
MNERIEEFAEDCKILGEKEFAGKVVGFNYKKFAELIVGECANVGERYANGNYEVYNQIMAHFGLEEE